MILVGITVVASPVDAETVIYGRLHSNEAYPDPVANKGSRFHLKDPQELSSGLKALFELEWQVDNGELLSSRNQQTENHPVYIASDADRESTAVGRQGTSYYNGANKVDIWDLSIDYRRGPLTIGTSFSNYREDGLENRELWGAATRYRFSDFALTAQYEYDRERDLEKSHEWTLMGEYYLGNNVLHARYSDRDWDGSTDPHWTFGLKHQINRRTSFYAEFQDNDRDTEQLYGAGIRHDF